jgi:hypothetical protein
VRWHWRGRDPQAHQPGEGVGVLCHPAASDKVPKFISPSDPAAQWTGAMRGPAFFAYADNYLIDVKFGVIIGVKASRAIRQAEVGASQTMIERTEQRFGLKPKWLAGDAAYGSGKNLNWLVNDNEIAPHIPVIDKSKREDGTFSREDFRFDKERNVYVCPTNTILTTTGTVINDGETLRYLATTSDCRGCRHSAGREGKDVQPILHHQACGRRHRAWSLDQSRHHRQAARRLDRGRHAAR